MDYTRFTILNIARRGRDGALLDLPMRAIVLRGDGLGFSGGGEKRHDRRRRHRSRVGSGRHSGESGSPRGARWVKLQRGQPWPDTLEML